MLRRNPLKLTNEWRWRLRTWLADKPALRELCAVREALFRLYRTKGYGRAKEALTRPIDAMAHSSLPERIVRPKRSCSSTGGEGLDQGGAEVSA